MALGKLLSLSLCSAVSVSTIVLYRSTSLSVAMIFNYTPRAPLSFTVLRHFQWPWSSSSPRSQDQPKAEPFWSFFSSNGLAMPSTSALMSGHFGLLTVTSTQRPQLEVASQHRHSTDCRTCRISSFTNSASIIPMFVQNFCTWQILGESGKIESRPRGFEGRCLRRIPRNHWEQRVTYEVSRRAGINNIVENVQQRCWEMAGSYSADKQEQASTQCT